jgi:hypothetical protein
MRTCIVAVAALATMAFSGAAFADQTGKKTPKTTTGPAVMTDAELDTVTAGVPALTVHGVGNFPGGVSPPDGNVVLGGNNLQGSPAPPPLVAGTVPAFSGHALQAAKPCVGC